MEKEGEVFRTFETENQVEKAPAIDKAKKADFFAMIKELADHMEVREETAFSKVVGKLASYPFMVHLVCVAMFIWFVSSMTPIFSPILYSLTLGSSLWYLFQIEKEQIAKQVKTREAAEIADHAARTKNQTFSDKETATWLNQLLVRFWPNLIEPIVSQSIRDSVQPYLDQYRPAFLEQLQIDACALGSRPPFVKGATSHIIPPEPKEKQGDEHGDEKEDKLGGVELVLHLELISSRDMILRIIAKLSEDSKLHPLKGMAFQAVLERIVLQGELRVRFSGLKAEYPYVGKMRIAFANRPTIDFKVKPLNLMDICEVPFVSTLVDKLLGDILASFVVEPNPLILNFVDILVGEEQHTNPKKPSVEIRVDVLEAANLVAADTDMSSLMSKKTSDPFVMVAILAETQKTSVVKRSLNPTWEESFIFHMWPVRP
ncbi:hypothetical protein CYMTET_35870 [Cymbomonas tetramitiformis]|uniref:C2 domain-containing protein n=1 Tax=Cymbomonas tetramitiformis TaxID=36881 RepID=A0AAE0F8B9_9CHLO|nr:hypothetical protein CYMTET_35870 [Cymbomonas tetramitiformis]